MMFARRTALANLLALAAAAVLPSSPALALGRLLGGADGRRTMQALSDLCGELRCPARMREACCEALPQPVVSMEDLAALVVAETGYCSPAGFRKAIGARIRKDFVEGKIVIVDGWLLSLTETQIYALGNLAEPQHSSRP
jgi:hypothetical protein